MSEYQARLSGTWPAPFNVGSSSARFNSGSSDYLSRTPSSTGNRQIFTISCWVKRSILTASGKNIMVAWDGAKASASFGSAIYFNSSDQIEVDHDIAGSDYTFNTNMVFRDVSAWYHIVLAVDTTQATAANRQTIYVNGSSVTLATSALGFPVQNFNTYFNFSGGENDIGSNYFSAGYADQYMSEFYLIDGQALTPSSFGQTDTTTGIWIPKAYTGTYGTNGFYLNFSNAASLGTDASGNGNNFTVNNLTSVDQSKDHPTNNFCTWNSLNKFADSTITDGNLTYTTSGTSQYEPAQCTIGFSAGKWYSEHKVNSIGATALFLGIYKTSLSGNVQSSMDTGRFAYNLQGGNIVKNASDIQTGLATFTTNDILGIAVDMTNGTIKFYKNGSQVGTTITDSDITNNEWTFGTQPRLCGYSSNFGQPPYSVSGGYSDGSGYGNFNYQPPSGFLALCTNNLASNG
jgi:hypothetical protein